MWFLRTLLTIFFGLMLGALATGVIAALPYPFSLVPLIPVCITMALVLRASPSMYWLCFIAVAVTDVYRAAGFGVGLLAYAILVYCMQRVTTEFVTHRSLIGCAVIAGGVGALWPALLIFFSTLFNWWHALPAAVNPLFALQTIALHTVLTMFISSALFLLLPRWWLARSPVRLGGSIL